MDEENETNVQKIKFTRRRWYAWGSRFHWCSCREESKSLYENGWFIEDIKYFNTVLKEYKVAYPDKTPDYLRIDDFDGIQVILL